LTKVNADPKSQARLSFELWSNTMKDASPSLAEGRQQLAQDVKSVVDDAEQLLRHAARDAGQGYDEARGRLEEKLKAAREEFARLEGVVVDRARRAGRATDGYVHDHPWESIGISAGIGAGIGLLLGLLIARR
jgi:ElaB/YqjD/DUF883 family membrane-anchored ribosome-binding protein